MQPQICTGMIATRSAVRITRSSAIEFYNVNSTNICNKKGAVHVESIVPNIEETKCEERVIARDDADETDLNDKEAKKEEEVEADVVYEITEGVAENREYGDNYIVECARDVEGGGSPLVYFSDIAIGAVVDAECVPNEQLHEQEDDGGDPSLQAVSAEGIENCCNPSNKLSIGSGMAIRVTGNSTNKSGRQSIAKLKRSKSHANMTQRLEPDGTTEAVGNRNHTEEYRTFPCDYAALYFPCSGEYVFEPIDVVLKEHGVFDLLDSVKLRYADGNEYTAVVLACSSSERFLDHIVKNHSELPKKLEQWFSEHPHLLAQSN